MVTVEFLGPIGREPVEIEAESLEDVKALLQEDAQLKEWLQSCAVAVNDGIVSSLDVKLRGGDRISLLPPVCGG